MAMALAIGYRYPRQALKNGAAVVLMVLTAKRSTGTWRASPGPTSRPGRPRRVAPSEWHTLVSSAGPWTGSGNQRVIDLAAARQAGYLVLLDVHECLPV